MSFANPWFLVAGALLLALVVWRSFSRVRHGAVRVGDGLAVRRDSAPGLARLWRLPDFLRIAALVVLVVAVARPQVPDRAELSGEGADIMVALDMSGSMNAVDRSMEEIEAIQAEGREPLNRFDVAREILGSFVSNRREDRVGLIVFGSEVYLKFPLTLDYRVVLDQLEELVLDDGLHGADEDCHNGCTITGSGTALGDALARSFRRLRDSAAKTKAIVLITDGKRQGGSLAPLTVANYIANQSEEVKVRVFTFLVGQATGAKLPRHVQEPDPQGPGWRVVVARDRRGRVLYAPSDQPFPTDPELLREIARLTDGRFFEAYDEEQFREQFAELEKTEFRTNTRVRMADAFVPWLLAGLLLLALEWLLRLTILRRFP